MGWWTRRQLRSHDAQKRLKAAMKLGVARDCQAVAALIRAMDDDVSVVRLAAARALADTADAEGNRCLLRALRTDHLRGGASPEELRVEAERLLLDMGKGAFDTLKWGLHNEVSLSIKDEAVRLLCKLGNAGIEILVCELKSATAGDRVPFDDDGMVCAIVKGLAKSGNSCALNALLDLTSRQIDWISTCEGPEIKHTIADIKKRLPTNRSTNNGVHA